MSRITVSVVIATIAVLLIAGVVAVMTLQLHTIVKCMVKMAENQKKASDQRRQDQLDLQLRISHIETRLNRMASSNRRRK